MEPHLYLVSEHDSELLHADHYGAYCILRGGLADVRQVWQALQQHQPRVLHTVGNHAYTFLQRVECCWPWLSRKYQWHASGLRLSQIQHKSFGLRLPQCQTLFVETASQLQRATQLGFNTVVEVTKPFALNWPDGKPIHEGQTILVLGHGATRQELQRMVWAFDVLKYAVPKCQLVVSAHVRHWQALKQFAMCLGYDDYRVWLVDPLAIEHWLPQCQLIWLPHTEAGVPAAQLAIQTSGPVVAQQNPDTATFLAEQPQVYFVDPTKPITLAEQSLALLLSSQYSPSPVAV